MSPVIIVVGALTLAVVLVDTGQPLDPFTFFHTVKGHLLILSCSRKLRGSSTELQGVNEGISSVLLGPHSKPLDHGDLPARLYLPPPRAGSRPSPFFHAMNGRTLELHRSFPTYFLPQRTLPFFPLFPQSTPFTLLNHTPSPFSVK